MAFAPDSPRDSETISVNDWLTDSSLTDSTRRNRRYLLNVFEEANHASIDQILADIKADRTTSYAVCKRFVDHIRKDRTPNTCYIWRIVSFNFLVAVLGEDRCKKSVFNRLVTYQKPYVTKTKKCPTPDDLRTMLSMAISLYRVLVGLLACTGMRINEALSRKMSDFEIRPDGHARIILRASETKARTQRYVFTTKEVMDWVTAYRQAFGITSEWLFSGEDNGHMSYIGVSYQIKNLFVKAGLKDTPCEIYSSHSFRTFADTQMGRAGLDRKWIELIIGHKNVLAASQVYKDWDSIEEEWVRLCEPKLTWLSNNGGAEERD